jgi:hypothetical protein
MMSKHRAKCQFSFEILPLPPFVVGGNDDVVLGLARVLVIVIVTP